VRLPTLSLSAEGQLQVSPTREIQLSLVHQPFSLSFGLLEEYVIVDPNAEEESLLNGTISIIMDDRGNVLNVLKSGGVGVSESKLDECLNLAKRRVKELLSVLDQTSSAS
jgi:exosome complex component RRP43